MKKLLMIIAIAMLGMTQMRGFDNWAMDRANFLLGNNYPQVTDTLQLEAVYDYPKSFDYKLKSAKIANLIDSALAIVPAAAEELKAYVPEKTIKDAAWYSREVLYIWLEFRRCYDEMGYNDQIKRILEGEEMELMGYKYVCEKKGVKYEILFDPSIREIIMIQKKE